MKTKVQPSHTQTYYYTSEYNSGGSSIVVRNDWTTSLSVGENRIDYEEGPSKLLVPYKRPNWKSCHHVGTNLRSVSQTTWNYDEYWRSGVHNFVRAMSVPVAPLSRFPMANSLAIPSPGSLVGDVIDKLYADIAGRCDSYLLSLEDFAGLFSGKSLVKSIRTTAQAYDVLAKGIVQATKLGKAFGFKQGAYSLWLSAREAIKETVGLRLGYRFSFKTTLNDIVQAVDFAQSFRTYANKIAFRNSSEFLMYSKGDAYRNDELVYLSPGNLRSQLFANQDTFRSWFVTNRTKGIFDTMTGAVVEKRAVRQAKCFARARVRYPLEYRDKARYMSQRFGLDKPLTTLWAIVPLSFVVDYLIGVQSALTYIDNKLNDYLVGMDVESAWVCEKTFRESTLSIPGASFRYVIPNTGGSTAVETIPSIRDVYQYNLDFRRYPISSSAIRANFPSLIMGDQNWIQHVGTGLELLTVMHR